MTSTNETQMKKIRPSSLSSYIDCKRKWYLSNIANIRTFSGNRAVLGTSVHASAEKLWLDSIKKQEKVYNINELKDIARDTIKHELENNEIRYDDNENQATTTDEAINSVDTFINDIVPTTPIPTHIEIYLEKQITPTWKIGGSIDYLDVNNGVVADIKTSRRNNNPDMYALQQTAYRILANHNDMPVNTNLIQGIILPKGNKSQYGVIKELYPQEEFTRAIVKDIITQVDKSNENNYEDLFQPNLASFLCSNKYCGYYGTDYCKLSKVKGI